MKRKFYDELELCDCIVPAIIGGIAALGAAGISAAVSRKNRKAQEKMYKDQQKENDLTREREDNAYQRSVADMRSAGLSPLGATGASAGSMSVADAPQMDSSFTQGISQAGQAAQQAFQNDLSLRAQQVQETVGNAQAGLFGSEQESYDINNSTLALENMQKILKLKAEIKSLGVDTKKQETWNKYLDEYIQSSIQGINAQAQNSLSSASKTSSDELLNLLSAQDNVARNMPIGTSHSLSYSGPFGLTGTAEYVGRLLGSGNKGDGSSKSEQNSSSIIDNVKSAINNSVSNLKAPARDKELTRHNDYVSTLSALHRAGKISDSAYFDALKAENKQFESRMKGLK